MYVNYSHTYIRRHILRLSTYIRTHTHAIIKIIIIIIKIIIIIIIVIIIIIIIRKKQKRKMTSDYQLTLILFCSLLKITLTDMDLTYNLCLRILYNLLAISSNP